MKGVVAAAAVCALGRTASAVVAKVAEAPRTAVALVTSRLAGEVEQAQPDPNKLYGDTSCPCIGFDGIEGDTLVTFPADVAHAPSPAMFLSVGAPSPAAAASPAVAAPGGGVQVHYAADMGAHCHSWDAGKHPQCKGDPVTDPDWCGKQWCFIDPCNCNFRDLPVKSEYVSDARYRGSPLFYSYETCGSKNTFSKNLPDFGSPRCRCVGLYNVPGTTDVHFDLAAWGGAKEVVSYPGDVGTSCKAWDKDMHPLCRSSNPPDFCTAKWCYVDPCECDMLDIPKVSMYLPKASHSGKHLYYNYATCGSVDTFTKKYNTGACFNQRTQAGCEALLKPDGEMKCGWTGSHCLGREMLTNPLCKRTAMKYGKRFHRIHSAATRASAMGALLPAAVAAAAAATMM